MNVYGVNLMVKDLLCQDARIQDLYFKITLLYIISDAPKYHII